PERICPGAATTLGRADRRHAAGDRGLYARRDRALAQGHQGRQRQARLIDTRKDAMEATAHRWPEEGLTRVPYWVYSDRALYEEEQARIFRGPTWNFLCLEAELPGPHSYRRSTLGAMPVVVTRDQDGTLHAFENRCAHRGSLLGLNESGAARASMCVYSTQML